MNDYMSGFSRGIRSSISFVLLSIHRTSDAVGDILKTQYTAAQQGAPK
jgi:hypothetical protein